MSTAIYELIDVLPARASELRRLLLLADNVLEQDEDSYNTLCRACSVLLASHLEGFLKDLTQSLLSDFNFYSGSFNKMPEAMRVTFCRKIATYDGVEEQDIKVRVSQLLAYFDKNSVAIDMRAFNYKENNNKNPNGNVVDVALQRLGVPDALQSISVTWSECVFNNDSAAVHEIKTDLRKFREALYNFPYNKIPNNYEFNHAVRKADKKIKTIWHTFISDLMLRRHNIVHGDTMANDSTTAQLHVDVDKLEVLMHSLVYSAVSYLCKEQTQQEA